MTSGIIFCLVALLASLVLVNGILDSIKTKKEGNTEGLFFDCFLITILVGVISFCIISAICCFGGIWSC